MAEYADGVAAVEIEVAPAAVILDVAALGANEAQGKADVIVGREDEAILGFS